MASKALIAGALGAVAILAVGGGIVGDRLLSHRDLEARVRAMTGGDPGAGELAIQRRPCGGCHEIPGIAGAHGKVGPPLDGFAGRVYIAGRANNTPDALIAFIRNPHSLDPQSAMPPMGIGEAEARDIAAYLLTLR